MRWLLREAQSPTAPALCFRSLCSPSNGNASLSTKGPPRCHLLPRHRRKEERECPFPRHPALGREKNGKSLQLWGGLFPHHHKCPSLGELHCKVEGVPTNSQKQPEAARGRGRVSAHTSAVTCECSALLLSLKDS